MDVIISCSKKATEVAKDVLLSNKKLKKPVLVFVERDDWERIEEREEVDTVNEAEGGDLERFKDKRAVFCWYEEDEAPMMQELGDFWRRFVGGDVVRVIFFYDYISKFWLARRIADKACDYEVVLGHFRRLPVVQEKTFPMPGRYDLLYDPKAMLNALETLKDSTRSAKVLLTAKAGIEEIKAVRDGEKETE